MTTQLEFIALAGRLAAAWSSQDTEAAIGCFTPDAIYLQPPDVQMYVGHEQLRRYFGALRPGTDMRFHHLWFNEDEQLGAGEFSFGRLGQEAFDHGVAVMKIRSGRIASLREYVQQGPAAFNEFLAVEGKEWQWHIGNYP